MGPITIFDKSFLQSLSLDEAVLFDHFFLSNICPIYFLETLADLKKIVKSGRSPEKEVSILAAKTPQHGKPNMFHTEIYTGNLLGYEVPMTLGQIVVKGGKPVKTPDQTGIIYEPSPEEEALSRWQDGKFFEVEQTFAKNWRFALKSMSFKRVIKNLKKVGLRPKECRTLEQSKHMAESLVSQSRLSVEHTHLLFDLLNLPSDIEGKVLQNWRKDLCPPLIKFAPYAAYFLIVELFFFIAAAANQISQEKVTNKIDLAYIYYLPFAMLFVSSDKFHRRCVPLFLRENQRFIWGPDLKDDLKNLDQYYSILSEREREKGLSAIASRPPNDDRYLVTRLWKQFLRKDLFSEPPSSVPRGESAKTLVDHLEKIANAKSLRPDEIDFDLSDTDAMVIKRKIRAKRGKYWLIPKDVAIKNKG